jgi:hypothetical protein
MREWLKVLRRELLPNWRVTLVGTAFHVNKEKHNSIETFDLLALRNFLLSILKIMAILSCSQGPSGQLIPIFL